MWELRRGARIATCEIYGEDCRVTGVDLQLIETGDILVAKRCVTADAARCAVEAFRQDYERAGYTEP